MSTDYSLQCLECRTYIHLGQRFSSGWSFGYGRNDEDGVANAVAFIIEHVGQRHTVEVRYSEDTEGDPDSREL